MRLLILLLLLIQPAPFSATWQSPTSARLAWAQPAGVSETCIVRIPAAGVSVLIGCWYDLPAGATGLTMWDTGPVSASFKPQAYDTYALTFDSEEAARAALRGVVYVPALRR